MRGCARIRGSFLRLSRKQAAKSRGGRGLQRCHSKVFFPSFRGWWLAGVSCRPEQSPAVVGPCGKWIFRKACSCTDLSQFGPEQCKQNEELLAWQRGNYGPTDSNKAGPPCLLQDPHHPLHRLLRAVPGGQRAEGESSQCDMALSTAGTATSCLRTAARSPAVSGRLCCAGPQPLRAARSCRRRPFQEPQEEDRDDRPQAGGAPGSSLSVRIMGSLAGW
jgi:hypothetical protein